LCVPEEVLKQQVRVILADDHASVLNSVRRSLEPEFEVIDAVADGERLVDRTLELDPDVVVVDIAMPGMGGIDAVRECLRRGARAHVVFLTGHSEPEFVERALAVGAEGDVLKAQAAVELPKAIAAVVAGQRYLSPSLSRG